ncbi:hypothetical protein INQ40_00465 [Lysobacter sp. H21R4]|uniref:hypothetical protein n=1 Tax=Lysobacter sp. H21R4 TaxID=2781021 RepID=UPI0018898534|nr:hypothetical protein INQ40_00465 [Lysobacter sp. H21R4]
MRAILLVLAALWVLAGCSSASPAANALDSAQYAWSGAIRWGDFGGARNLVDPAVREANPLSPLQMERYEQVQVSSYRDVGGALDTANGRAVRNIEIGVINRHTMAERTVRYLEQWRWDADAKAWWLVSDLPDLWAGQ